MIADLDEGENFQYDGAPCHRSSTIQQSLADESVSQLTDRPTQSGDLNIIEQMWTELKRRVLQKNPCNLEELYELSYRKWYHMPVKMVKNLFKRIKAIIQITRSHKKY